MSSVPHKPTLRRRLATALGSIAGVTILVSAVLMVMLMRLNASVDHIREDAETANEGLGLALAVREQYMHEAHSLIERTDSHLGHHAEIVRRVEARARALTVRLSGEPRRRVERVAEMSRRMDVVFRQDAMPAMHAGDLATMRRTHATLLEVSMDVIDETDQLVETLRGRMRATELRTQRASWAAVAVGVAGVLLVLGLAVLHSLTLRKAILGPLALLERRARQLGRGEEVEAFGEFATGELATVGKAFDRMAEELRAREEELTRRERMAAIGELATGVAHEINNPVGVILGYLGTMIPEARDEAQREELEILQQEARACQRIVEDLKTFARAPAVHPAEVDAKAFLEDAARRFRARGEDGPELDVQADDAFCRLDATRMHQVLANLLINAAQAAPAETKIELQGEAVGQRYRVRVCDHGAGVPEDERERIFEPFHTKRPGGTGLGLAVARGIVGAHGGELAVEETPGGGATFVIDLPRGAKTDGEEASA